MITPKQAKQAIEALKDFVKRLEEVGEDVDLAVPEALNVYTDEQLQEILELHFKKKCVVDKKKRCAPPCNDMHGPEPKPSWWDVKDWAFEPTLHELERQPRPPLRPPREKASTGVPREFTRLHMWSPPVLGMIDTFYARGEREKLRKGYGLALLVTCPKCEAYAGKPCKALTSSPTCPPVGFNTTPHTQRRAKAQLYVGRLEMEAREREGARRKETPPLAEAEENVHVRLPVVGRFFQDTEIDDLFSHIDSRQWDKMDKHAQRCAYWLSKTERARRRRAHWVFEARRKGSTFTRKNMRSGGTHRKREEKPPLNPVPAGYFLSELDIPPWAKDGCYRQPAKQPLENFDSDRAGTGNYYINRTWRVGTDRRWG